MLFLQSISSLILLFKLSISSTYLFKTCPFKLLLEIICSSTNVSKYSLQLITLFPDSLNKFPNFTIISVPQSLRPIFDFVTEIIAMMIKTTMKTIMFIIATIIFLSLGISIKISINVSIPIKAEITLLYSLNNFLYDIFDFIVLSPINNNLLEQIKTICTAWLSEYKPFDGVMPSDWVETPLSDIAEFISGYSYKGTELTDSTIAMATIKNFDRKGGFKLDGYKEIIPSSKLKESQHAELFDTLVAHTDLTQNAEVIGNAEPIMSKSGYDDIVFSMDLVKVLPKKDGVSKFLIAAILQDKKFKAHCLGYVNGTTVLHLSKKALPEYKLFLPSDFSTLKPLDEVVTALYKRVSSNISENTYLEELRESLLPKLMSGELDVSDIEI